MLRKSIAAIAAFLIAGPAARADTLKGSASQDDWRDTVLPTLEPGQPFGEDMLPKRFPTIWLQVPDWQAGVWRSLTQTKIVDGIAEAPIMSSEIIRMGSQVDKNGHVWMKTNVPCLNSIDRGQIHVFSLNYMLSYKLADSGQVEERLDSIGVYTMRGVVIKKSRQTSTTFFAKSSPDSMKMSGTVDGKNEVLVCDCRKVAPFKVDPSETQEFYDWLNANGHADLVP